MARKDALLNQVYQALGANRVQQRWIKPYREKRAEISVLGLSESDRVITVSPLALLHVLIHECLHAAHPTWSEGTVERASTYLYRRLSDAESKALYHAYAAKVQIIVKPVDCE